MEIGILINILVNPYYIIDIISYIDVISYIEIISNTIDIISVELR